MNDQERLALALEALALAEGIMSYCRGDAWEQECTEADRMKFDELYAKLQPPPTKDPAPVKKVFTCATCGKQMNSKQSRKNHEKDAHGSKEMQNFNK